MITVSPPLSRRERGGAGVRGVDGEGVAAGAEVDGELLERGVGDARIAAGAVIPSPVIRVVVSSPVFAAVSPVSSTASRSAPVSAPGPEPPSTTSSALIAFTLPPVFVHAVFVVPVPAALRADGDPVGVLAGGDAVLDVDGPHGHAVAAGEGADLDEFDVAWVIVPRVVSRHRHRRRRPDGCGRSRRSDVDDEVVGGGGAPDLERGPNRWSRPRAPRGRSSG